MEVGDELTAGQGTEIREGHGEWLGHDAADLDRWVCGDGRRRPVELHAEAWKPVDAYLSWRETAYSELHHSLFLHTVAYGGTVHERCPRVHTGAYARLSAMATAHTSRTRWVDEGLRALAAAGPDSIRVETIARELGVTKGGFYWHFQDRSELLHEVLDEWERLLLDEVIEQVEAKGGDARAKLRRLFAMASDDAVRVDLAVHDWARHDPDVANRLRHVDNRRMDYMRTLFGAFCTDEDDVEVRCVLAFSLWIGNHFMAAEHRGRSRAHVMRLAVRSLLATPAG